VQMLWATSSFSSNSTEELSVLNVTIPRRGLVENVKIETPAILCMPWVELILVACRAFKAFPPFVRLHCSRKFH